MITLKASLIDPNKRKVRVGCYRCKLSYTARNYLILYDGEKLAYFKFKPLEFKRAKIFCHDCLHKECLRMLKGGHKKIKLLMKTLEEDQIICTFEQ